MNAIELDLNGPMILYIKLMRKKMKKTKKSIN